MYELVPRRAGWVEVIGGGQAEPSVDRTILVAYAVILVAFGGAMLWATFARLDSAAAAVGVVNVEGFRKTVQHLEGGIVTSLDVKEGDRVRTGQVLLRLSDVQSRAMLTQALEQYVSTRVRIARLRAEQTDSRTLSFDPELTRGIPDPVARRILEDQQRLFEARWQAYESDVGVLREQAQQAYQQVATFQAREKAAAEQLVYIDEELSGIEELFAKGLERKPRLMAAKRAAAMVRGQRDEARSEHERAARTLGVAEAQIRARRQQRAAEVGTELDQAQVQLADHTARLKAFGDTVGRTEVRAPIDGTVVNLRVHTLGGVVGAGQPIMEIVPEFDGLTVDAQVRPEDIDVVKAGLPARLRLVAYAQRRTPLIDGVVERVSADRMVNERTGEAYFVVRVRPNPGELDKLADVELSPGMPVDVLITTGRRTALDYLLAPITDSITRAMIED